MSNFKIIQDVPDQARIKIYGSQNVAINTDSQGSIAITSTGLAITAPTDGLAITATGLSITPPTNGLAITATGLSITPPTNGLAITATGLSITPPTNGLAITATGLSITPPTNGLAITATGLSITPPTDGLAITATGLSITPPTDGLAITSLGLAITAPPNGLLVTSTGLPVITQLTITDTLTPINNVNNTTFLATAPVDVMELTRWSYGVVNDSLESNAQALVQMQISPDGTAWANDSGVVTVDIDTLSTIVPNTFLKYARLNYQAVNSASAVTLNIYFQGQG